MKINYGPRGILQIDDARICFRNFRGEGDVYNQEGRRNFSVVIPTLELAEELRSDQNEFGVGWNVKISEPREEGDTPFMHLPVKVTFKDGRGPKVYLKSGANTIQLNEDTVQRLDTISIRSVDLDIRPYDGNTLNGRPCKPFRSAQLQAIWVTQEFDRFEARFAEEEYPQE
jgi:hypothetical protein